MKPIIIESSYAGDVDKNVAFAENVCRYAVNQGHAPFASHLFYTRFLNDDVEEERQKGIYAGLEWSNYAKEVWACLPEGRGFSPGMRLAINYHILHGHNVLVKVFNEEGTILLRWNRLANLIEIK